jgi:hypothetical protein
MTFIGAERSIIEMAHSLIKYKVVPNYLPVRRSITWNHSSQTPVWIDDKETKLCIDVRYNSYTHHTCICMHVIHVQCNYNWYG